MTRKRIDNHGTEFGSWVREPERLNSKLGYTATDVDYMWRNYRTGLWMLIEEKRNMATMNLAQCRSHHFLDCVCKKDKSYCGFHLLQFENQSPEDGKIYWNTHEISADELIYKLEVLNTMEPGYFELAADNKLATQGYNKTQKQKKQTHEQIHA